MRYSKYKKSLDYSYTLGAYPTINMLQSIPEYATSVFVSDRIEEAKLGELRRACDESKTRLEIGANKLVERLRDKDSVDVVGIFKKFDRRVLDEKKHLVLVSPSDFGNLGSIMRSAAAFYFDDIVIISPAVDVFNPKLVRSSMGEIFKLRFTYFESFEDYRRAYKDRKIYTFMLKGKTLLSEVEKDADEKYSLVFGNESSGLDDSYLQYESIKINHRPSVDSLNLSNAVAIALHSFENSPAVSLRGTK